MGKTVKMMGVKMGQAKMVSYKIKFWKLSILSWKCFYILPKPKIKSASSIISATLWHVQSCVMENLDFAFLKWQFANGNFKMTIWRVWFSLS